MRPARAALAALFAVRLAAAVSLAPTPARDESVFPAPGLFVRPFVQAVSATGASLVFETVVPLAARVTVGGATVADPAVRLHSITVRELTADTQYDFSVTLDGAPEPAATGRFRTWPADLSTVRFFAYGDTRTRPAEHRRVCAAMAALAAGHLFVLHSGDLVADGRRHDLWQSEFFDPGAELFAQLPVLPIAGNHERGTELFPAYFELPDSEWSWGLTVGPVHVTALDFYKVNWATADWRESAEGKWLLAELQKAQASPWRVAMLHTPLWSRGPHGKLDADGHPVEGPMRFAVEVLFPLLKQAGYRIVFSGHDHLYERSERDGLTAVTSGGGGAPNYALGPESQNPYSKVVVSAVHYCDVEADARSFHLTARDPDGKVLDEFTLTQP
ncbi:MAG: metallophosphoesterase [Armatimonadetes bacterium]|nr:metallophosphoesterase [Armatimonadota bacterium]